MQRNRLQELAGIDEIKIIRGVSTFFAKLQPYFPNIRIGKYKFSGGGEIEGIYLTKDQHFWFLFNHEGKTCITYEEPRAYGTKSSKYEDKIIKWIIKYQDFIKEAGDKL